ncbi:ribosome-associated translation inhibitor RaiA [Patescibacteria group bacterium]|nr:ribosome-associated translation inhibitor RaiA [Patescibacteria group bacterium]
MRVVEIVGSNMDLTEAIKKRVEKRLANVAKLCTNVEPCDVRVDVGKTTTGQAKGKIFRAEYNLTVPGKMLRAESIEEDLYAAIDVAAKDLRRQMKKYKETM